jgi:hypothetical protein
VTTSSLDDIGAEPCRTPPITSTRNELLGDENQNHICGYENVRRSRLDTQIVASSHFSSPHIIKADGGIFVQDHSQQHSQPMNNSNSRSHAIVEMW